MGSVLHLQCCVVYETVMDSISLWLLEIWVLWDVMVCQVSGFRHFKGS